MTEWKRRRAAGLRWVALAIVAVTGSGCIGVLNPQGPVGQAEKLILINSVAIMLTIVIPTILVTLFVAWWFRASNKKASYQPDFVYSGQIELIVWAIPILVVVLLGGIAWIGSHDLDPPKPLVASVKPLEVQVVSLDWKWLFIYPEQGIATVNQLIIPAGTPVHFELTSSSVMNAFFVPQLGGMIYTMHGMRTNLNLLANQPGEFHGLSSNYSGNGFSGMNFTVRAVAGADFPAWVETAQQSTKVLDDAAYIALSHPTQNVPPTIYKLGSPELFRSILTQKLPPGPGPATGPMHAAPASAEAPKVEMPAMPGMPDAEAPHSMMPASLSSKQEG
ncbi:ubiquinol oxidase subunit II [Kaistia sp. UC242_56]|uniref:ubiquinol oxidase subunit II n=1 Tax=Kaistia sp. UC242_56 TaxID=3374625 RepID=UPI0037896436